MENACGKCEVCFNVVDEVHCPKQLNNGYIVPGKYHTSESRSSLILTRIRNVPRILHHRCSLHFPYT